VRVGGENEQKDGRVQLRTTGRNGRQAASTTGPWMLDADGWQGRQASQWW
jgi:hypothetical protein